MSPREGVRARRPEHAAATHAEPEFAVCCSTCPSGKSGGSLGEFGPGQMVKEFNDVVFTTGKVGKVSRSMWPHVRHPVLFRSGLGQLAAR